LTGRDVTDDEILHLLKEALRDTVPERAAEFEMLSLDCELRDLALGSLSTMEMVSYIEDQLATTFRREDMAKLSRVSDLAALIRGARAGGA